MSSPLVAVNDLLKGTCHEELGRGSEGIVYGLPDGKRAYKEFIRDVGDTPPNRDALERLVNARARFGADVTRRLDERTRWPDQLVVSGAETVGFVMPRIPAHFVHLYGTRRAPRQVVCDWNFLSMRHRYRNNPNLYSEVPDPPIDVVLMLVADLAETVAQLHALGVVLGDISGRNLLWAVEPDPIVMVIDCDGFRVGDNDGVIAPKQSPDWEDPHLPSSMTTQQSDIYKLALAAFRALWSASTDRPPQTLQPPDGVPSVVADLIAASVKPSARPTAAEWSQKIGYSVRFANRPAIQMRPPGTHRVVMPAPKTSPAVRPTIPVSKRSGR